MTHLTDSIRHSPDFRNLKSIISHPGAMATTLHAVAYKYFGEDIYSWEPETLEMEFEDEFGTQLSSVGANRLHALITALSTDAFFTDWVVFGSISTSLCSEDGEPDMSGQLSTAEIAWGTTEVLLNDSEKPQWSPEVARFAGTIQAEDGLIKPISILSFADMPSSYLGSYSGSDIGQLNSIESSHKEVIEQFIEEQSLMLFKQLSLLPWMKQEDLEKLSSHIHLG